MGAHRKEKLTYEEIINLYHKYVEDPDTGKMRVSIKDFAKFCGMSRDVITAAINNYKQNHHQQLLEKHNPPPTDKTDVERCIEEFESWALDNNLIYPNSPLTQKIISDMTNLLRKFVQQ